jgi:hypothetical protein
MRSPASENQRIAVRGGARDPPGPDAAATASHVFDDHGLTEGRSHTLCQNARKGVGAATCSKWHTQGDGARWITLRPSDYDGQCRSAGGEMQKLPTAMKSHGVSSLGSPFAYRALWNFRLANYSPFIFAALMIGHHLAISAF